MEQENNQNEAVLQEAATSPQTAPAPTAPSMLMLLKEGWNFFLNRRDLVTWYIVLLVVFSALTSELVMALENIITFVAMLAGFVLFIFSMINSWAILYAVAQPDPQSVSYTQAFNWSAQNFLPLIWTSLLAGLATFFGFILFVVPGIIITIYLQFSVYAMATGTKYGLPALKQSYHDVKGRWWQVAKKLFMLGFWLLLIFGVAVFVISFAIVTSNEDPLAALVAEALVSGVGGVVSVMSMYALAHYYKYLKAHPISQSNIIDKKAST